MYRYRSLMVALVATLLCAGSPGARWLTARCTDCGAHCPMLAKRLGCHEGSRASHASCHDRAGPHLASCAHSSETATGVTWLAVFLPTFDVRPLSRSPELFETADVLLAGELPEPPTDPPRTVS